MPAGIEELVAATCHYVRITLTHLSSITLRLSDVRVSQY